ncbi:MAG: aminotransferase class III-fold pyridoxal phosphate-dependent enzyme, partial [Bacteroidales bacterium]
DKDGTEYLDMYGGHAVISVGHGHHIYNEKIKSQLDNISFYSNSIVNSMQAALAAELGEISGYTGYSLFLSNSGAEANENALKLASFHTGKSKVLAFKGAFHGRSSGAVAVTDNPSIISPFNSGHNVCFVALNDIEAVRQELSTGEYAAVIIEGIQGVAGIYSPKIKFMKELRKETKRRGTVLILDEVQSGYGRSGKFFAHQHTGIKADIVTIAKGMGNGFPVGGTIISPAFTPISGMLGSTFGGNHLACAACLAVLQIIKEENLVTTAAKKGKYLLENLLSLRERVGEGVISDIRGVGLMVGLDMCESYIPVRNSLLFEEKIFTGGAKSNIIRLLPPLTISYEQIDKFIVAFERSIEKNKERLML